MKAARAARERTEQQLIRAHEQKPGADRKGGARHESLATPAQPAERHVEVRRERAEWGVVPVTPRDRHDIERRRRVDDAPASKQLADPALRAIAYDRAAQLARRDDAKPIVAAGVRQSKQCDKAGRNFPAVRLHRRELPTMTQTRIRPKRFGQRESWCDQDETVRRLRPFARRRLSTVRPFLVRIRTRKPCVRRRRRRLGWKVRFMGSGNSCRLTANLGS